jgi:hypothetical protein
MRKLFVIITLSILFAGCGFLQTSLPHYEQNFLIDFRKYSSHDFLFSTGDFNGKYTSIGILTTDYFPEVKLKPRGEKGRNYDKEKYMEVNNFLVEKINYDDVINKMYKEAESKGANAVINILVSREQHPYYIPNLKSYYDPYLQSLGYGWVITGMAIKRL